MNIEGILIGLATFIIIGVFHPIVIKSEYHFGKRIWPLFLILGLVFIVASLYTSSFTFSAILGVIAFSFFWSIKEIFEQEQRVEKGQFPKKIK